MRKTKNAVFAYSYLLPSALLTLVLGIYPIAQHSAICSTITKVMERPALSV